MHTMIDITVFLLFISFTCGAVYRHNGDMGEEEFRLSQLKDLLLSRDDGLKIIQSDMRDVDLMEGEEDDDNDIESDHDKHPIIITDTTVKGSEQQDADPWSVIWYLGAFSGLITFFLVVTCSEWCCGNHLYTRHYGTNQVYANSFTNASYRPPETPPPPYHLFAPPSYSDTVKNGQEKQKPPKKSNIFIIPIHRIRGNSTS